MSSLTLYIANKNYSSWSCRGWLALEESGLPFEEITVALDKENTLFQIQSRSPSGRLPLLDLGDTFIWDSLAIGEYVAERCEKDHSLLPIDPIQRARARSLCAEMHSGFLNLRSELPMNIRLRSERSDITTATQSEIQRIFQAWSQCLKSQTRTGPFLFGTWSLADSYFAPIHFRFRSYGVMYPSAELLRYRDAVLNRASVKKWEQAALLETDRIPKYEDLF